MDLKKRVTTSIVVALAVFFVAIFVPFIPCKVIPVPLNADPSWSFCSLNPDSMTDFLTSRIVYFGYTESLTNAYIAIISLVFILVFIISIVLFKSKRR